MVRDMDRWQVNQWLQRCVQAWKTCDAGQRRPLSEQAEYRYHPHDSPVRGRDAIVQSWVQDSDLPGTFDARYTTVAVDHDVAVAVGTTTYYSDGRVARIYDNRFVMRVDDRGLCRDFTE
jgi:hypothetical protein